MSAARAMTSSPMESVKDRLKHLEQDSHALLAFINNVNYHDTLEMSIIRLVQNRMQYIWQLINMDTMTPDYLLVMGDYRKGIQLIVSKARKMSIESFGASASGGRGTSGADEADVFYIYKPLSEPFSGCFCRIRRRVNGAWMRTTCINADMLLQCLYQWASSSTTSADHNQVVARAGARGSKCKWPHQKLRRSSLPPLVPTSDVDMYEDPVVPTTTISIKTVRIKDDNHSHHHGIDDESSSSSPRTLPLFLKMKRHSSPLLNRGKSAG